MSFKWIEFLHRHNIHYVEYGPNTKKGEISIKCPMCGDDPSEHLGINPRTGLWACWRSASHRGRSPFRLIMALLHCSYARARIIVEQHAYTDPDEFEELTNIRKEITNPSTALKLPNAFHPIGPKATRFTDYLQKRGFDSPIKVVDVYDLHYAVTGRWKDRIIFPIYLGGELVTWTGRAIVNPKMAGRYLTASPDDENPAERALLPITETVYQYDDLMQTGGDLLFFNEGPFDAIKIDYYGYHDYTRATCFFTANMSVSQHDMVSDLCKHFKKTRLLLDPEAIEQQFSIIDQLGRHGVRLSVLEPGIEDPGAMQQSQVLDLIDKELLAYS